MLAEVICDKFLKEVGKGQGLVRNAMLITFRSVTNFDLEEGYRHIELLIYAPSNYVQVWVRDTSDVIPLEDMEEQGEEMVPKKGTGYTKSATEWKLIGDHDSCWRDAVEKLLKDRKNDIIGFSGSGAGFTTLLAPLELDTLREEQRKL